MSVLFTFKNNRHITSFVLVIRFNKALDVFVMYCMFKNNNNTRYKEEGQHKILNS